MEITNQTDNTGLVSIIMGIYNCEPFLSRAIDSIIGQAYENWELIMCDDGSSDRTYEVAQEYAEKYPGKIILIKNRVNQGLNITLNNCLRKARGEFVARQDADDYSYPTRFEKQVQYLRERPEVSFVSAGMYVNNGSEVIGLRLQKSIRPEASGFMHSNQFFHAPVMIRRDAITAVGGYTEDKRLLRVEDLNLWTKLYAAGFIGENMMEGLYEVWEDDLTYSRRKLKYRFNGAYAKILAIKMLRLPVYNYCFVAMGILKGFIPKAVYRHLHSGKARRG